MTVLSNNGDGDTSSMIQSDMDMDAITQVLLDTSEIPPDTMDGKINDEGNLENNQTSQDGLANKFNEIEIDDDESNTTLDFDDIDIKPVKTEEISCKIIQDQLVKSEQPQLVQDLQKVDEKHEPQQSNQFKVKDLDQVKIQQPVVSKPIVSNKPKINITRAMDSNDAKIIQYQYSILKSKMILSNIKQMQTSFTLNSIPLINYIILYTRGIFAINEKDFGPRLEKLNQFQLFNSSTPVNISAVVTHIPYDVNDLAIIPLDDLPPIEQARKCLTLLEGLLKTAIAGYQKRLSAATNDESLIDSISSLIKTIVSPQDFDLSLIDMSFTLPPKEYRKDDDVIEASLIDMDISSMLLNIKYSRLILNTLKPLISKYKLINDFKKIPNYALHEIFLLSLRLNDLYNIFRNFGRKVYLSNLSHLHDQKFLAQAKNGSYLKMSLSKLEDLFNTNKKNGTLIATLTRFVRQNSQFEINSKNIKDLINFVNQGSNVISTSLEVMEDYMINWTLAELNFRKTYELPRKSLLAIYNKFQPTPQSPVNPPTLSIKTTKVLPPISTTRRRKSSNASLTLPLSSVSSQESFPSINKVQEVTTSQVNGSNRDSRSSSVSSTNSNNSLRMISKASLKRPNSVYLNTQATNSLSKLDTSPEVTTRHRSNSNPIPAGKNQALAGAAAALSIGLRSPMGSVRRQSPNKTSLSELTSPTRASPSVSNKKINQQLHAVAEEEVRVTAPVKLSANQRLQQHLRQASKSGALMTQQKELLTSVTFDPSNPSATNLKRPEKAVQASVQPLTVASSTSSNSTLQMSETNEANADPLVTRPTMFGKPTKRDTVTRRNTRSNSKSTAQMVELEMDTSSSSNSSVNGTVKKVRFTGVPEYTEVEDMPTNYANQILKNFPSARIPSYKNHQAVKKKDLMLKKEESMLWRNELHKV